MSDSLKRTSAVNRSGRNSMLGSGQFHFAEMMEANKDVIVEKVSHPLEASEVAKHNSADDCWSVYKNKVYDITRYLDMHPGGRQHLLDYAGMDMTEEFLEVHPWVNAEFLLKSLLIGDLKKESECNDSTLRADNTHSEN